MARFRDFGPEGPSTETFTELIRDVAKSQSVDEPYATVGLRTSLSTFRGRPSNQKALGRTRERTHEYRHPPR